MNTTFLFLAIHAYDLLIRFLILTTPRRSTNASRLAKMGEKERHDLPSAFRDAPDTVWLHAASLGEAKVLSTFMTVLRKKHPDDSYVVTAVTEPGVAYLRRHTNDAVCAAGFLPLDTLALMEKMVRRFSVKRVWLIETELWPAMLWICMKHGIPVGVVNARMEEKSFRIYRLFRPVLRPLFAHIRVLLAQDTAYASRFEAMGARPAAIAVTGNLKSSICIKTPEKTLKNALRSAMRCDPEGFVVTAGCVHPKEAAVIRQACDLLHSQGLRWQCIVVPRHLEKTPDLLAELGENAVHTRTTAVAREWKICLVDMVGALEEMYMIADAAVIGGTFVPVGGHNIWEAAQWAIPVFFGPYYFKQNESGTRVLNARIGFCVDTPRKLAEELARIASGGLPGFTAALSAFQQSTTSDRYALERYIP